MPPGFFLTLIGRSDSIHVRHNGEDRWVALGRVNELVLVVVYTLRGSNIRLISARKANKNDYGKD
jgi:uncharacterized DUF497 family protein